MRKESLRRHGLLEGVQGTSGVELFRKAGAEVQEDSKYLTEKKAKPLGSEQKEESASPRTQNEAILEGYRGAGGLQKMKDGKLPHE